MSPTTAEPDLQTVAGAILAGGQSRRWGSDKAMAVIGGRTLLDSVALSLAAAGASPLALVGGTPRPCAVQLDTVVDRRAGCGPLAGIEAALTWSPRPVVAIGACDLPDVTPRTWRALVRLVERPHIDIAAAGGTRRQPLCAVWSVDRCLATVVDHLDAGHRSVFGLFDRLRVTWLAVPAAELRNLNEPGDLSGR